MMPGPSRATFQTKFFLSALASATIALAVAGALFATTARRQLDQRIEQTLVAEARLAADLLARDRTLAALSELDGEADRIGALIAARVGFGDDELGTVARALDESVQEVGRQLAQQARDRARTEAILAGMIEGVIVVDAGGRLQLVNDAARQMLKLDDVGIGRPYVETI